MKYVSSFVDRHGYTRHRFRKRGRKTAYFKSPPGTEEFEREYASFLECPAEPPKERPSLPPISLVRQLPPALNRGGHVYFIEAENGLIKIGFSASVRERFKKLGTAVPLELTLLGLHRAEQWAERRLHEMFAAQRVQGEWFKPSDELRAIARGTELEQRLTHSSNPVGSD